MLPRHHQLRDFRPGPHHADRQPAADGLAERHDVRLDPAATRPLEELVREPTPRASAAGPDFVEDQRELVLVAQVTDFRDVVVRIQI